MTVLVAPDPDWPRQAERAIADWTAKIPGLLAVHHVGSTAVQGLPAKPVIDLLPVFASEAAASQSRPAVEAMGYEWLGNYGLPGRYYCRQSDPDTGLRIVQAHGYVMGDARIAGYLAFRDALRQNGPLRAAYTAEKARCAARHPEGGAAYGQCKSGWIARAETVALARAE
ncbi:MAG: GrpB family protein [Pseudomonadota bacterium]